MKEKIPMDIEWMKMKELQKINDRIKCWEKWAKTRFRTQGSGYTSENVKYLFFAQVEKQIWRWRIEKLKELVIVWTINLMSSDYIYKSRKKEQVFVFWAVIVMKLV